MVRPMRLVNVEIQPITMPKLDPAWRFALAASPESDGFLVTVRADDGALGIGYTSATPHLGATAGAVLADLRTLGRGLAGREIANAAVLDGLVGSNQAKAGLDLALHDLFARQAGVPLHRLLGGMVRAEVPLLRILALKAPDDVARNARLLVDEGYAYLKVKLDGDTEADVARVRAVREAVGPDVHLTVDANQSYAADAAIRAIERMAPFGIDLFEQPVRADDIAGLARIARAVETPIEADESAQSVADVFRLVAARAVDSVSLKLPKLGGLGPTRAAAAICAAGGVRCRVGATVGSRLLAAAALHFAAATPNIDYACELAEFARLRDDPAEGLEVERGILRVPQGIGVGVRLREGVRA